MSDPTPTGRPGKRLRQTVMDMVRSMGLVLLAVGIVGLLVWRPTTASVRVVDVDMTHDLASRQAGVDLAVPGSSAGLQATSVRWEPTEASGAAPVWHVGYVMDGDRYLQISQSTAGGAAYLAEQTANGQPEGAVAIAGREWQRYETSQRRSLVYSTGVWTTIVSGTADWSRLEQVAGALRGSLDQSSAVAA